MPVRTNKIYKNRILNSYNPGKELNELKSRENNFLSKEKTIISHIKIINLLS